MIAAVRLGVAALPIHGASELATPDNQRVLEHAALLEVLHERSRALIDFLGDFWMPLRQSAVMIPPAVIDLNEAHAASRRGGARAGNWPRGCRAPLASGPYKSNVELGSLLTSVRSGTDICMRYAISYAAMRVLISGSPVCSRRCAFIFASCVEQLAFVLRIVAPVGSCRCNTGSPEPRSFTPW